MNDWIKRIFFLTVFLTGAAVLIVEVSAVRMLAPYFGSSLYVLSSVLSVILFALSVGYYAGGKMSDRYPYHIPLYIIITSAGLVLLALTLLAQHFLPVWAPKQPLLIGPLFFSIILFFIPAFMLGADSPYVIKLLSLKAKTEEQGQLVGATFFWSTAGSITGSISSGFFLIPTFGLNETIVGTAVFLVIFGIGGGLLLRKLYKKTGQYDPRNDLKLKTPIAIVLIVTTLILFFIFKQSKDPNLVFETDGYYSNIKIFTGKYRGEPTLFMKRDINNSSARYLNSDELVYTYSQYLNLFPDLKPDAENFLVLGGGAYSIPKAAHDLNPEMQIDVVELEPLLYDLAVEYFDLPETDKIQNHTMDARVFLSKTDKIYDVMFLDTFSTGHFVPPHLVTQEYFLSLKSKLAEDGIIIINFIGSQPKLNTRTLTGSFTKTLESVFPNYTVYTSRTNHLQSPQNLMYIIRNNDEPLVITDDTERIIKLANQDITLDKLAVDKNTLVNEHDQILTDNKSPIETLLLKERFIY